MTAPIAPFTFDVLDPTLFSRGAAHQVFDWLRANDPVHRDERNELWVVSKYDDVAHVERQPETFISGRGVRPKGDDVNLSIASMDDPEHARQRRLIARGFTPKRIGELTERIRSVTRELVDQIAHRGECDFVTDLAAPLPLIVIAELLGLPVDDREQLRHWSDTMIAGEGSVAGDSKLDAAGQAWAEYVTYLAALLEDRRVHPRDDLISVLLSSADAGELGFDPAALDAAIASGDPRSGLSLGGDDILSFLTLLLVAGNETTRNALSGGVLALSRFPEQRDRLVADLTLVPSATEEILR